MVHPQRIVLRGRPGRPWRHAPSSGLLGSLLLALALGAACARPAPTAPTVLDLSGDAVEAPRALAKGEAARVLVFVQSECPIANRYAPVLHDLVERFGARDVAFRLVYPVEGDDPTSIAKHLDDYAFGVTDRAAVWIDAGGALARSLGVTVTPEVCVFASDGEPVYRGRIDDRYASLGEARPRASVHDLARTLEEILAGRPVSVPQTEAVGCRL